MPNTLEIANKRLRYLKRKLQSSDKFAFDYNEFKNNLIGKSFCEVFPFSEVEGQLHRTWYLPHHGVYHPRKNKLIVVFDCGANFHGVNINSLLLPGPNVTANLDHVISRFRQEVAMMADIESMFYQVKVRPEDRDFLRFLWFPDGNIQKKTIPYRMKVHIFGATSSPACANLALKKTAENKNQSDQAVIECIERNFYIDDFLKSVSTFEEAKDIIKGLESLCKSGGFKLKDWSFNQKSLVKVVSNKTKSKKLVGIDLDKEPIPSENALGLFWCVERDSFIFKVEVSREISKTRRGIMSFVSSIYDPLGWIGPFTLPARMLLQELCKRGGSWDE